MDFDWHFNRTDTMVKVYYTGVLYWFCFVYGNKNGQNQTEQKNTVHAYINDRWNAYYIHAGIDLLCNASCDEGFITGIFL